MIEIGQNDEVGTMVFLHETIWMFPESRLIVNGKLENTKTCERTHFDRHTRIVFAVSTAEVRI